MDGIAVKIGTVGGQKGSTTTGAGTKISDALGGQIVLFFLAANPFADAIDAVGEQRDIRAPFTPFAIAFVLIGCQQVKQ